LCISGGKMVSAVGNQLENKFKRLKSATRPPYGYN
jgi:hypothetical protein